jgi:uncharacterized protein YdhG (YjbR/CyaY superfamily)
MGEMDQLVDAVDDPEIRAIVVRLRELIVKAVPEAVESRSYGMPAYRYRDKPLAGVSAARAHVGFYPMSGDLIERHAAELAAFSTSKGTLRLTPQTGIPEAVITALVLERKAQIDGAGG